MALGSVKARKIFWGDVFRMRCSETLFSAIKLFFTPTRLAFRISPFLMWCLLHVCLVPTKLVVKRPKLQVDLRQFKGRFATNASHHRVFGQTLRCTSFSPVRQAKSRPINCYQVCYSRIKTVSNGCGTNVVQQQKTSV